MKKANMWKISNEIENMKKNKYDGNPERKREYQKTNTRKILNQKENMEKNKYEENTEPKKVHEKSKCEKNYHLNDPQIFQLVKTYQVHTYSGTYWKYNKNDCRFPHGRCFTEKTIIAKPLHSRFSNVEKQENLTRKNTLLNQVKSYVDNNLYPAKVNVIDPIKDNFTQQL